MKGTESKISVLRLASEWITLAPHLPRCQIRYGPIMQKEGYCSCGRDDLLVALACRLLRERQHQKLRRQCGDGREEREQ